MTLDYDVNAEITALASFSQQALAWGANVHEAIALGKNPLTILAIDADFNAWSDNVRASNAIPVNTLDALKKLYFQAKGSAANKELFASSYNSFMNALLVIERDLITSAAGIDVPTGLRHRTVMLKDISREMERLTRQGEPFSIALIQISNFAGIKERHMDGSEQIYERQVADIIKQSIRSFDDAYYIGEGAFVVALKLSKSDGGIKSIERLKATLDKKDIEIKTLEGSLGFISLTCRVAEPIPGDDPEDIINNLKLDVDRSGDDETVFEYQEISPLQRFVQDQ